MSEPPDRSLRRLSEERVRRLLARAVEIDAHRADELTLAQLREVAKDADISPDALAAALREEEASNAAHSPPRPNSRAWVEFLKRNTLALGGTWIAVELLDTLAGLARVSWTAEKAIQVVALSLGVGLAVRLRASPARLLLLGLTVASVVELALDAVAGAPAVRGAWAHFALYGASILALWIGSRSRGRGLDTVLSSESNESTTRRHEEREERDILKLRGGSLPQQSLKPESA